MNGERIDELITLYRDSLLGDTIPFWTRHSVDRDLGGFFTFLDRDGSVFCTDKPVWLQGRIAWLFARLYNQVEKRPEWLELSRHAVDFLLKHCFDTDGRMFFLVTRDGQPLRKRRYLFSEAFAVMGLAEYALASGDSSARQKASDLFDLILHYCQTPGLLEPKENPLTRPMKSHAMPMILLVLSQVLRQVDGRPLCLQTADESIYQILNRHCHPERRALLEHVGPDGQFIDTPEGRTVTPGHGLESAWFIMEEGRLRNDRDLSLKALPILEWSLERGWDEEHGGLLYFVDVDGKPCVQYEWDMKLWWPHTEALYATLLAARVTSDERWLTLHERIFNYAFGHFPDGEHGEWYGYLHRDGTVSTRLKGNCWKGPFHLGRAELNCWKILEEIRAAGEGSPAQ